MRRVCHGLKAKNISTLGFLSGTVVEHLSANARDDALILGSGRCPGVGNGNPVFLTRKSHGQRSLVHAVATRVKQDRVTKQQYKDMCISAPEW